MRKQHRARTAENARTAGKWAILLWRSRFSGILFLMIWVSSECQLREKWSAEFDLQGPKGTWKRRVPWKAMISTVAGSTQSSSCKWHLPCWPQLRNTYMRRDKQELPVRWSNRVLLPLPGKQWVGNAILQGCKPIEWYLRTHIKIYPKFKHHFCKTIYWPQITGYNKCMKIVHAFNKSGY